MNNTTINKSCEGESLARWHVVYHKSASSTLHIFINALNEEDAIVKAIEYHTGKKYRHCLTKERSKYSVTGTVDSRFYEKHKATDYERYW